MSGSLWLALSLVFIFEGLLPFALPATWRTIFSKVSDLSDGQIRFLGLASLGAGVIIFLLCEL